jgi:hypothetical protein
MAEPVASTKQVSLNSECLRDWPECHAVPEQKVSRGFKRNGELSQGSGFSVAGGRTPTWLRI